VRARVRVGVRVRVGARKGGTWYFVEIVLIDPVMSMHRACTRMRPRIMTCLGLGNNHHLRKVVL
jgi:hypothetical protein